MRGSPRILFPFLFKGIPKASLGLSVGYHDGNGREIAWGDGCVIARPYVLTLNRL